MPKRANGYDLRSRLRTAPIICSIKSQDHQWELQKEPNTKKQPKTQLMIRCQ